MRNKNCHYWNRSCWCSSIAFATVLKGLCSHLVLAGRNMTKAQGDALDLQHTLAFCERPIIIETSAVAEVKDCDILVITAPH